MDGVTCGHNKKTDRANDGSDMPRVARRESSTSLYHVVNRGFGKQIIFEDDSDRSFFMRRLDALLDEHHAKLLAWCLMDNHFHLLLDIPFEELPRIMHRLQTSYAGYFNRVHGGVGSLFGTRYRSEPVETEGYLMTVVRYIHENPVKAKLPGGLEYQWSSYSEYMLKPKHISPSLVLETFGGKDQLVAFHHAEHPDDNCLEIVDKPTSRLTDEQAQSIARGVLSGESVLRVKGLEREQRDAAIAKLKQRGLSVRQIQRLTGLSLGVISKACKERGERER